MFFSNLQYGQVSTQRKYCVFGKRPERWSRRWWWPPSFKRVHTFAGMHTRTGDQARCEIWSTLSILRSSHFGLILVSNFIISNFEFVNQSRRSKNYANKCQRLLAHLDVSQCTNLKATVFFYQVSFSHPFTSLWPFTTLELNSKYFGPKFNR